MRSSKTTLALLGFASLVAASSFACGGSPPPEAASPAPAASSEASSADAGSVNAEPAVDTAALEKLTLAESKSGTCDPEHKAALEQVLEKIEASVRGKTEDGTPLAIESFTKRTVALSDAARGVQLTLSGKGTQVHVIAVAPKEVSMDVLAGNQPVATTRSTLKPEVTPATIDLPKIGREVPLEGDSRQFDMKPGTPLDVRLRGQGCAGLVVLSKS